MQLCIHTQGVEVDENFRTMAKQKLDLALDLLEDRVKKISIYIIDTNGPERGGEDKFCRVVVNIHKQDSLVLEDRDASVGVVVDRITDRLGVAACRRAEKLRDKRVKPSHWKPYVDRLDW